MRIVTKVCCLDKSFYLKFCFFNAIKEQWYFSLLFLLISCSGWYFKMYWLMILGIIFEILFLLFWVMQVYAAAYYLHSGIFFQKHYYEISEDRIIIFHSPLQKNENFLLKWEQIKKIKKKNNMYVFIISKIQILCFPKSIFKSEIEYGLFCALLKRISSF